MAINPMADPNKPAVYAAEREWQGRSGIAGAALTAHQARKLSRQILNHPALDDVPGVAEARKSLLAKVSVRSGLIDRVAPGTVAATNGLGMTLYSRRKPITVGVVTHETAHKIMAHSGTEVAHGPEFAELHGRIVRHTIGPVAHGNLDASYKRHGAK